MPSEIAITTPNSVAAIDLVNQLGHDALLDWSADVLANSDHGSLDALLPLLHTAANDLRSKGAVNEAETFYREVLKHFDQDFNVRFSLAQFAAARGDEAIVYDLLAPVLTSVLFYSDIYPDVFRMFCRAAFVRMDLQAVKTVGGTSLEQANIQVGSDELAIAISARLSTLDSLGFFDKRSSSLGDNVVDTALYKVLSALDEHAMLVHLAEAQSCLSQQGRVSAFGAELMAICIVIARDACWGRQFRAACRLASTAMALSDDPGTILKAIEARGFSERFRHALALMALNPPGGESLDEDRKTQILDAVGSLDEARRAELLAGQRCFAEAITAFRQAPDINSAKAVWTAAANAAHFEAILGYVPGARIEDDSEKDDPYREQLRLAASVYRPATVQDKGPEIWFFITWHEDPEKLFRLYTSLHRARNRYVVSIGGSKPLNEHAILSPMLLFGDIHLLYRPSVSWGGQKLLYYNLFEVLQCFKEQSNADALFQIICNRTYPLATPSEFARLMGTPGHRETFARRRYSIPPPAWNHEWPQEMVAALPEIFDKAMDTLFTNADASDFVKLATFPMIYDSSDFRIDQSAFNFSTEPLVFEGQFKDGAQNYTISAHAADHRWMSFGRLTTFVDMMDENQATYTRRMHPKIMRWVHSVLIKHDLRTGDPFVLMTRRFVETLLTDERCNELFAAMDLGFGPEMNYFDTVSYSPQYDLRFDLSHQYFRTATNNACEADIAEASYGSDVLKLVFMRKMLPGTAGPFIAEFAARINEDRPADCRYLSVGTPNSSIPVCLPPTLKQLFRHPLTKLPFTLRDFRGKPCFVGRFEADGVLTHEDGTVSEGRWRLDETGLVLEFSWGQKVYNQLSSDGTKLILPPSEIVSVRNAWSLFVEIDLAVFAEVYQAQTQTIVADDGIVPTEAVWFEASTTIGSTLLHFEETPPSDYPAVFTQPAVTVVETRRMGDALAALLTVDNFPALLNLDSIAFANGKVVRVFRRGSDASLQTWEAAEHADLRTALDSKTVPTEYRFEMLHNTYLLRLDQSGMITIDGAWVGRWFAEPGAIWMFGLPGLTVARATEFRFEGGLWTIAGWGQSTLHHVNSFRACQTSVAA